MTPAMISEQIVVSAIAARDPGATCLQHQSLERWVLRQLGTVEHERRVVRTAVKLFDLTWPLHGLGRRERRILRLAALVHDVGRAIDDATHPKQGARMIREASHLPLVNSERRALAYLTRRHRGKVPDPAGDKYLARIDDSAALLMVLALLRAADTLDSRSLASPRLAFAMRGRLLRIHCQLDSDCLKARKTYSRRKKFRLLEELLGVRVEVHVTQTVALRRVA